MKLKELLLIVLCALPLLSFATEVEQTIDLNVEARKGKQPRSVISVPMLSQDENILFNYSDVSLENLQIKVADEFGNVIYVENVSIVAESKHSLYMNLGLTSQYTIELNCGSNFLYGSFFYK